VGVDVNNGVVGSEIAWLPLDPKLRERERFDVEKLSEWFHEVEDSDYSFVKEFFAGIDHANLAFTMPFNEAALPVFLRLFEKYA
jgi:hypothetical protein